MGIIRVPDKQEIDLGTAYWIKYIKNRIANNKNFLGVICGPTGSGKSYGALTLMALLNDGKLEMKNVFQKNTEFLERLTSGELKPGTVLLWDEVGVGQNSKEWQSKANRTINKVLQTFRSENLIVLFTLPLFSFLDSDARKLVHAVMTTQGIDFETEILTVKPLHIQTNQITGKMYLKKLRVKVKGKGVVPIKTIKLKKLPKIELEPYEKIKDIYNKQLYQDSKDEINGLKNKERSLKIVKPLTERQKQVVEAYKIHKDQKKVAELVGLSQGNVSNYLKYARKKQEIELLA